jgi:hypothetical protein
MGCAHNPPRERVGRASSPASPDWRHPCVSIGGRAIVCTMAGSTRPWCCCRPSISHDETLVRELREDPEFAAEYLKAAMADDEESAVLLIALRHVAEAFESGGPAPIPFEELGEVTTVALDVVGSLAGNLG